VNNQLVDFERRLEWFVQLCEDGYEMPSFEVAAAQQEVYEAMYRMMARRQFGTA
jgi:hypothetical protein